MIICHLLQSHIHNPRQTPLNCTGHHRPLTFGMQSPSNQRITILLSPYVSHTCSFIGFETYIMVDNFPPPNNHVTHFTIESCGTCNRK